ncbi:MAG: lamin tail domain-containing protein [Candidatus Polarisedimenticolaceae bacterium]|nr:lamin tail domain-containing protein [Candidatus Polarisedimenticolaceae bacterium]
MIQIPLGALSTLFFILIHNTAAASLIINEIDYDQPSYDRAEFIELLNTGPDLLNLDDYTLSLINGISGEAYRSFTLTSYQLAANDYFVLCGNSSLTINCDFDSGIGSNLIQNGGTLPDAIALYFSSVRLETCSNLKEKYL